MAAPGGPTYRGGPSCRMPRPRPVAVSAPSAPPPNGGGGPLRTPRRGMEGRAAEKGPRRERGGAAGVAGDGGENYDHRAGDSDEARGEPCTSNSVAKAAAG